MNIIDNDKPKIDEEILYQNNIVYVPVNTGELLVYYAEIINGTIFEFAHFHPCYEIYYVTRGSINMRLNDRSLRLKKGHFVLIMPGVDHEVAYEPAVDSQFFVITFEFCPRTGKDIKSRDILIERFELDTLMRTLKVQDYYTCLDKFSCNKIIAKIDMELKDKNIGWNMTVLNLYLQFIISVLRNISFTSSYPPSSRKNINAAIEISKYMHKHFHEDITLKSVADTLNMTTRNVSRIFKEYFGTTFGKTLSRFRFNRAKYYLITTDYSVEEISKLVGLKSPRTIFNMFKEHEGLTVTQFRNQNRQKISFKPDLP